MKEHFTRMKTKLQVCVAKLTCMPAVQELLHTETGELL
jgi:hypothetical protein